MTLSYKLKTGISQIVSVTQSEFFTYRSIQDNIGVIFDLIEYSNLMEEDGFILFLDFYKAFDSLLFSNF